MDTTRRSPVAWPFFAALLVLLLPSLAFAEQDAFTQAIESDSPLLAGVMAFGGGLLTCLTPCVYPMIAITVSVFGARSASTWRERVMLSSAFVLGIVVLFTSMLVGAALTGAIFGRALSNPWVLATIAVVFIALAASMFGAFEMTLPDGLMQRLSTVGGLGYGGAFLLGLVSGVIAAPCTGPVLTGILIWIGRTQNVALGAVVGTLFSLGLGLPFFLVGAFAVSLPKGGKWMLSVKSFFGVVMLVVALHYLQVAFPILIQPVKGTSTFLLAMIGLVVVGLILGAVHLDWGDGGTGIKVRKGVGILATTLGGFWAWAAIDVPVVNDAVAATEAAPGASPVAWEHSEQTATTRAKAENKPLLIDFTADWCAACKELSKHTFSDPRVMAEASRFVACKVDATDDEDEQINAVKEKYKVVGLPTVVLYDSKGQERKRFNEFVDAEKFLAAIKEVN
jgi:thiol:disulfide interchange protein DsbD